MTIEIVVKVKEITDKSKYVSVKDQNGNLINKIMQGDEVSIYLWKDRFLTFTEEVIDTIVVNEQPVHGKHSSKE